MAKRAGSYLKLKEENKHVEFMQSFKFLALEMKKVDPNLVLEPVATGSKQGRVEDPRFLPNNFTELSAIVCWFYWVVPRGPGAHKGPNQVPYCYIRRTLVYTLGAYTEELLHTTFDANSCTNG